MAFVCNREFGKSNNAGNGVRFTTKVYATSSGDFVFYGIPDEVLRVMDGKAKSRLEMNRRTNRTGLHVEKMGDGAAIIGRAMDALLTETVTEEYVIRYHYSSTCHYWLGSDGKIYANGVDADESQQDGGNWQDPVINGESDSFRSSWRQGQNYMIGFMAVVSKKVTYKSGDNVKVEIKHPSEEEVGEWANMLNGFSNVGVGADCKEIPYTEEVARLFYNSMIRLCEVSRSLTEFLEDPINLLAGNDIPLLAAGQAAMCGKSDKGIE